MSAMSAARKILIAAVVLVVVLGLGFAWGHAGLQSAQQALGDTCAQAAHRHAALLA